MKLIILHREPRLENDARPTIVSELCEVTENTRRVHTPVAEAMTGESARNTINLSEPTGYPPWRFDPLAPSLYYGPSDQNIPLPPLHVSRSLPHYVLNTVRCLTVQDHHAGSRPLLRCF